MRAVVLFVEPVECVGLRASTQAFESLGTFASVDEFAATADPNDEDLLLYGDRITVLGMAKKLDQLIEYGPNGERSYLYIDYENRGVRILGKYRSYADAVQDAQRHLMDKKGLVIDFDKSRLWTLQLERVRGGVN